MSPINLFVDTHVCYARLKLHSKLLTDEKDKKLLLDLLPQLQEERNFSVHAFSVLDDELHFLLSAPWKERGRFAETLRSLTGQYRDWGQEYRVRNNRLLEGVRESKTWDGGMGGALMPGDQLQGVRERDYGIQEAREAESGYLEETYELPRRMEDLPQICMRIHMRPVELDYVKNVKDYWWSSFQTYRGAYDWKGLDISPMLAFFSDNEEKGRRLFLKMYRKQRNGAATEGAAV